jgi:hypothetical protein
MNTKLHWKRYKSIILFLMIPLSIAGCYGSRMTVGNHNLPLYHTNEGENLGTCTQCHEENDTEFPYRRFDHTPAFIDNHTAAASENENVCTMCHNRSFCSDCHGAGVELNPSDKNYTDVKQSMPHRGDYITTHRIDGRIDPAKCFRCHGNPKNQRSCRTCHG